jgi:phosphinothricin acetyltransferase
MGVVIRDALADDAPALAAVYGHHVLHGLGTFEETPPPAEEMASRLSAVRRRGLPYLVAVGQGGEILGFAYASPFRLRAAYRYVAEDSIYVAPGHVGRGVGKALLGAVIDRCAGLGLRQMIAVIGDSGNAASIGLHAALGFATAGAAPGVGFKHGRWLDIVMMHLALNGGAATPPDGAGLDLGGA